MRTAALSASALFVLLALLDLLDGTPGMAKTALWAGLSALLYAVLHPVRVTAGPGWLAVRGLWRGGHVCT
ncbi:hypothetical protein ABZ366_33035, partial [Streptomyces sp. NPDC005904]